MKKPKLDERTQKALETISCGDKVKFYDCFEAIVYGDTVFRVMSEHPLIIKNNVFVKLQHLGLFPIGRLKRVDDCFIFSEEEMKKALRCCAEDVNNPKCDKCPYNVLPTTTCSIQMLKDNNDRIRRIEEFKKYK